MAVEKHAERDPRSDRGATVVEYALLISAIVLVLVQVIFEFGDELSVQLDAMAALLF